MTKRLLAVAAILSAFISLWLTSEQRGSAAQPVYLPFPAGTVSKVIQGYNGGTHRGVDQYSLDLVISGADTTGYPVVAPISGQIDWAYGPWVRNGCLAILMGDGSGLGVMLCHVIFDRSFSRGESIALGQRLGYIGPAGTVGNNGTPHVHLQLYRGGSGARTPLPFASGSGLPLDGVELPNSGRYNDHAGVVITSGNGASAPAEGRSVTGGQSSRGAARPRNALEIPVVVRGTWLCLTVWSDLGPAAEPVECLLDGTPATVVEGPVFTGGYSWYRLDGWGWVDGNYLKPVAE